MKTAQEWADQWHLGRHSLQEIFQAIQADAYRAGLLKAAKVCRDVKKMRGANIVSETWHLHKIAKAIEAEAKKGQP